MTKYQDLTSSRPFSSRNIERIWWTITPRRQRTNQRDAQPVKELCISLGIRTRARNAATFDKTRRCKTWWSGMTERI